MDIGRRNDDTHHQPRRHQQNHQPPQRRYLARMLLLGRIIWTSNVVVFVHCEQAYPMGCLNKPTEYYDYDNTMVFPPRMEDDDKSSSYVTMKSTSDYLLVRRLGAGKFSDVFEAVDIELENKYYNTMAVVKQQQAKTNEHDKEQHNDNDSNDNEHPMIDPRTLVVIKCLKPVSERKIKRELLVLQHATKLPNLARLRAIVIPTDYYSSEESNANGNNSDSSKTTTKTTTTATSPKTTSSGGDPSSTATKNTSLDDASDGKAPKATTTTSNTNNKLKKRDKYKLQSMPSLVLEHAGVHSQWLCHDHHTASTTTATSTTSTSKEEEEDDDGYLTDYEIRYYLYHLLVGLDALVRFYIRIIIACFACIVCDIILVGRMFLLCSI